MDSFASLVKVSLSEWPTLQLAMEQGMGGPQAKEKEEWMATVLTEFFTSNVGSSLEELSDYIEDIMDNEFDTVIHDSSSDLLAARLFRFYQMVKDGKFEEVNEVLRVKLEQMEEKRKKAEQVPQLVNNPTNPSQSTATSSQNQDQTRSSSPHGSQGMEVDDGWTVVTKKGKRKSDI